MLGMVVWAGWCQSWSHHNTSEGWWGMGRAFSTGRLGLIHWPRGSPLPSAAVTLLTCTCPC